MDPLIISTLAVVLLIAVGTDIRQSRIPNWLTFPAAGCGLALHGWIDGVSGVVFSLIGCVIGLGIFLALHVAGVIGAGDVKLMAAVGSMLGPYGVVVASVLTIMVGGVYALAAMAYQWGIAGTGRKLFASAQGALLMGGASWAQELRLPFRLRYGVAIAGGTLLFQTGFHPFGG